MTPFELVGEGLRVQEALSHLNLLTYLTPKCRTRMLAARRAELLLSRCDVWTSLCRVSDDAAWCGVRDDGGEMYGLSRAEDFLWTVAFLFNVTCGHASGIEG